MKNSCKNKTDKFLIVAPDSCVDAVVLSKIKLSRLTSNNEEEIPTLYPDMPLNPRIHPVKVVEVIPV